MKAFEYTTPRDLKQASEQLGNDHRRAKLLAGGIDLLSEMKERIIELENVGVNLLLLQCSPQLEEMERFSETVIPLVREGRHAAIA